ncbi:MAG TPA: protein kinase [Candidatus Bathyarchaeia archaeon]|nr:protein kinase [Candidatus Bathyarchaeia archaeon]
MQKLGKYEILMELGHGAMGVVYKAKDPSIGRLVALKTINSNLVDRPDLLERFYQEAQSAGKLQHPNIVTIFELGQEKDTPFIAMEYLDGDSLEKTIVRQTDLPLALRVGYIVRICQALEYAHKNRVVHRDIKPGNIMVNSEGVVKVVDFGIARLVDFSRTHTNMMIGTPAYMAPELFRKKKADERTDIWAVGVTFFELLCYQRPFTGEAYDIIQSILEDDVPAVSSSVPHCPAEIEAVMQRMLRKASAERYQSMEDVLLDLEPVWNRLKSSEAAMLAERGRELYELGDLVKAQERLRRARLIDSTNNLAKSLLEKITAEVRHREIAPKLEQHLLHGRRYMQSGQLREAQAEAEMALGLDSRHEPAQKLMAEVGAAVAHARQLEQKLRLAKQRLAEGALEEAESALQQATDLDATNAQVLDLRRQVESERARRQRRKQVSEVLHRAKTLWTELQYDECLAVLAEGLKTFPDEPELKNLQDTAHADQAEQKKQAQVGEVRRLVAQQKFAEARKALEALTREQPQDATVRNLQALLAQEEQEQKRKKRLEEELAGVRGLISSGNLAEAMARGEALLREFPQAYEIRDLVAYTKSEVAQQEQKKKEQEREKQIRALLDAQRYGEALGVARQAVQEFPKQELFRSFVAGAERLGKQQQEREKAQREIQQRVQEIRSKIKRQELSDAIDLAKQTLATFGTDTDVKQLLNAAELEAAEREKKRDERSRQVEAARTLLDRGDLTGAAQLLDEAIAANVLQPNDMQVRLLRAQIAEKQQVLWTIEERRKRDEERKRAEQNAEDERKGKAQEQKGKPPAKESQAPHREEKPSSDRGRSDPRHVTPGPLPSPVAEPRINEPAATQLGATQLGAAAARPRPSVPVITPVPVAPPQAARIQTEIRLAETVRLGSQTPAKRGVLKNPLVLGALILVLAAGGYAGVKIFHRAPAAAPSAEDLALEAEAKQLWNDHQMDAALADWTKLASRPGPLHHEATAQMNDINQKHIEVEGEYAQGLKLLYEDKKYPEAAEKFNDVLQMNLWRTDEARKEYDIASKGAASTASSTNWQVMFAAGKQAFDNKDYGTALRNIEPVAHSTGVPTDLDDKAHQLLSAIQSRQEQIKNINQGFELMRAGQKQPARDLFARVVAAPNGDPDVAARASREIALIDSANYGPILGEVRELIGQGRWDDADAKLQTLPPSQPEYNDLKRQIEAGRSADPFVQRVLLFAQAETNKNRDALRGLRPFFMNEANKDSKHSGEARNIVNQIDTDLRQFDAGPGSAADTAAIYAMLQRFAKACDKGNIAAVQAVRQYAPSDAQKLPELLEKVKGKGYSVQNCSVPQVSGTEARVSCDVVLKKLKEAKPLRTNFELRQLEGQWIIVATN